MEFISRPIAHGAMERHADSAYTTLITGFAASNLDLIGDGTHFGVVFEGEMRLETSERLRMLRGGDFFCHAGRARVLATGRGVIITAVGYRGIDLFGGPIEEVGRLKYIDGCTDTLLIPPVRRGDPCLNHLHFPPHIVQTPHTHPSVRAGVVLRGSGECVLEDGVVPLLAGRVFILPTGMLHSFNTGENSMDVIAFHPDSDFGPTDEDHPMINRTIVDGVSANHIEAIRTR